MNITDEEIRIKVAEVMGASWHSVLTGPQSERLVLAFSQWTNLGPLRWELSDGRILSPQISNYPEDLNACHEMEKSLVTVGEWISYMENLASVATIPTNGATAWELVCKMSHSDQKGVLYGLAGFVHATARQRCLAYLRVKEILP